jgi:cytochrome oxidase assembly protein ShyY1
LQWRSARVTGSYLAQATVLIRNRPHSTGANDSSNGYEVVVPLRLPSGAVLLINRGWIPASETTALRPDSVPAPPPGTVSVVARLRPSEEASAKSAPAGQAIRVNARQLATRLPSPLNQRVIDGFAVLRSETPATASTPAELEPPDPGIGINLAYAVQWWLFALSAYVLLAIAAIKEVRRRATA